MKHSLSLPMNGQARRWRGARGMTLIELLVVLVILTLVAGLIGPQVLNQLGGAKVKTAGVQIKEIEQALDLYKLDVGRYPNDAEGLRGLTDHGPIAKDSSVEARRFCRRKIALIRAISSATENGLVT